MMTIRDFEDAISKARTIRAIHVDVLRMQKAGIGKSLEARYYQICAELVKELAEAKKPSEETKNG